MDQIEIEVVESESGRRYTAKLSGYTSEAELDVSRVNAELVIAAHTGVPDEMSGLGVGMALVERLIADAREEGFRIIPLCPFVKAQYRRHSEWSDVIRG